MSDPHDVLLNIIGLAAGAPGVGQKEYEDALVALATLESRSHEAPVIVYEDADSVTSQQIVLCPACGSLVASSRTDDHDEFHHQAEDR